MAAVDSKRLTVEEFLDLPDDGVERILIDGEVRELGMTVRNWRHATVQANLTYLLRRWLADRPRPRGRVVDGDAGFRLGAGTLVGVDVAYVSAGLAAATTPDQAYFDGPPTLAVEVLSPSDTQGDVDAKIAGYLAAGVPLVWVVRPSEGTVTVYRPDARPEMFNEGHSIDAEPHLPGFRAEVAAIFED